MIIRQATKDDLQQITQLFIELTKDEASYLQDSFKPLINLREPKEKYCSDMLEEHIQNQKGLFLLAQEQDDILGFIFGYYKDLEKTDAYDSPRAGYISDLVVTQKARGKNIASKLKDELVSWFKKQQCEYLELFVIKNNPAAQIYEKWGFETTILRMHKKL